MSLAEIAQALSEAHRKHLDPSGPAPARMMAARGLAPLPPREMVMVLAGLTFDADTALADAARASLVKLPDKIYAAALGGALPAAALAPIATALTGRDEPLERMVVSRDTPDAVIALVAATASEKIAEIIANDQERLLRSRDLVLALKNNPAVLKSSVDRTFDFLVRSGVIHDDMSETADALARLSTTDFEQAVKSIDLPPEIMAMVEEPRPADAPPSAESAAADAKAVAVEKALEANIPQNEKEERVPMLKLVSTLSVAQKVALAIRGNREARSLLVRDTNRMVATAAIRSPRITEQEVKSVASSRTVHDEVIRIIAASREMTRSYGVKVALAGNPKTPLPVAMKFLPLLRDADVKIMAKSKNVPAAVAAQARRMVQNRSQGGKE